MEKKLKEIESINLDFAGQTVFEKLDEGVAYFNNPLRDEDDDDFVNIRALNVRLERLKSKNVELVDTKRKLVDKAKDRVGEIRALRDKMDRLR